MPSQGRINVTGMHKAGPTVIVVEYDPEWPRRFDDLRPRHGTAGGGANPSRLTPVRLRGRM